MFPDSTPSRCGEALRSSVTRAGRSQRGLRAGGRRAASRRPIILTGFMGTGKTAVGRCLARRLGYRFVDTDALIEQREGRSVAEIFAAKGEDYFRAREREVVADLAAERGVVVATGGGTVVDEGNFRLLAAAGTVICLAASPEVILERAGGEQRPLLCGEDRLARIISLLATRAGAYARAPYTIDTSGLSIEAVVERILALPPVAAAGGRAEKPC